MIVLAAGAGTRFGGDKLVAPVAGRTVIDRCLDAFDASPLVGRIVVVAPMPSPVAELAARPRATPVAVVPGGATRHLSERAGLEAVLTGGPTGLVGFHDAARPFVTEELVHALVEAAARGGAVPVVPSPWPLFHLDGGRAVQLDPQPVRVQTPQVFRTEVAVAAFALEGGEQDADTAQTVARTGAAIAAVPGDDRNEKITHRADLARFHATEREAG